MMTQTDTSREKRLMLPMARARLLIAGIVIVGPWIAGCGTIVNVCAVYSQDADYEPPFGRPYGGAAFDAEAAWDVAWAHEKYSYETPSFMAIFYLLDLPLSLAGDTVTLPLIIAAQIRTPAER